MAYEYPGLASCLRCRDLVVIRAGSRGRIEVMNPGPCAREEIPRSLGRNWQGFQMPGGSYHRGTLCRPFSLVDPPARPATGLEPGLAMDASVEDAIAAEELADCLATLERIAIALGCAHDETPAGRAALVERAEEVRADLERLKATIGDYRRGRSWED